MPGIGIIPEFNQGGSLNRRRTDASGGYRDRVENALQAGTGGRRRNVRGGGFTGPVIEADEGQNTQQQTDQTQAAATTIIWSDSSGSTNLSDDNVKGNTGDEVVTAGNEAGVDTDVSDNISDLLNVSDGVQNYLDNLNSKIDDEQNKKKKAQMLMFGLALLGGESMANAALLAKDTIFFDDTQLNSLLDSKDEIIGRAENKYLSDQGLKPIPGTKGTGSGAVGSKPTATSQKEVIRLANSAESRIETNNSIDGIIRNVDAAGGSEGYAGTAAEFIKNAFGEQDEISLWKKNFTNLINTEVVNNLPPGVASDKDIELIKSGFPTEHWDKKTIVLWMQAYKKINNYLAARENFRARHIEETGRFTGWQTGFDEYWESGNKTAVSSGVGSGSSSDDSDVDLDLTDL